MSDTNLPAICAIIIRNSKGEYFLEQRAANKKSYPNMYALGAGGHVEPGETKEEAAKRELLEETKLKSEPAYLFDIEFPEIPQLDHVFEVITDELFEGDKTEWQWWGWVSQEEVDSIWKEGKMCLDVAVYYDRYRQLKGIE